MEDWSEDWIEENHRLSSHCTTAFITESMDALMRNDGNSVR